MGAAKQPKAPDQAKLYEQGVKTDIKYLPEKQRAEYDARKEYNDKYAQLAVELQDKYGGTVVNQYKKMLKQADPQGVAIRAQLGDAVSSDLADGYSLGDEYSRELEQEVRGGQAARGNILGNSAGSAEAIFKGKNAINLYQQRLNNAGTFLQTATPESQFSQLPQASALYGSGGQYNYLNPNAGNQGVQWGNQTYQNAMNANQNKANPWVGAAAGAVSLGATAYKGSGGNPYVTAAGAIIGGAGGYSSAG